MSIVAMKRNAINRYFKPVSGQGRDGFSLVGGRRNIGAVGPTNLGRSVTRTPFKGALPKGHGGCCGTYEVSICNSGSCCTNDPSIIKTTVKNTAGMLDEKYKWTKSVYPRYWVQDTSPESFSQGSYISKQKALAAGRCGQVTATDAGEPTPCSDGGCVVWVGGIPKYRSMLAKDPKGAVSSSEYMEGRLLKNNCLPSPASQQPFPFTLSHNGCDVNYNTWQEAQAAGQLPPNYVG